MSDPNDRQVAGTHYHNGGEQHWDRVARLNLDYFQAQITKYVERAWKKNGIEDLEKAQHFLEKYIAMHKDRMGTSLRDIIKASGNFHSSPEMSKAIADHERMLMQEIKPSAFNDFVFEGGDMSKNLYTCRLCNAKLWIDKDDPPWTQHTCGGGRTGPF